ncbi:MAG: cytidine deaminase [Verrucomicrobia bacterium]|nr:MAG: cytidine deaminase [Verrucomicrobiota bacterium]
MSEAKTADREFEALLAAAREAAARAHAPYSGFKVGAAVRTAAGGVFAGCNVENASYGLTVCAERNAVAAAVAGEGASMRIVAAAVFVDALRLFPPCGACRQVLAEFGGAGTRILYAGAGGQAPVCTTLGALLPEAFGL